MSARLRDSKIDLRSVASVWEQLRNRTPIGVIGSRRQYNAMVELAETLLDEIGTDEGHPLAELLELVGALIQQYEKENVKLPRARPVDVLRFLMDQHGLRQSDLRDEIGSQGVVSEILSGKREINARQARALAARFKVSPVSFI